MDIWSTDATNFNPDNHNSEIIYRTSAIDRFLKVGKGDDIHFLVGPKGFGKSMLLRRKAYLYLEEHPDSSFRNAAGTELTENIQFSGASFSKKELLKFKQFELWYDIWYFCICTTILKASAVELPSDLRKRIGQGERLNDLLSTVLSDRTELGFYLKFIPELTRLVVQKINSGVLLCVDSIDHGFLQVLNIPDATDFEVRELPDAAKVWMHTQNAVIAVSYQLHNLNKHVRVMGAIRSEAFSNFEHPLIGNFKARKEELKFNEDELKEMFERKISLMNETDMAMPKAKDPLERFLGFTDMPHPYAGVSSGQTKMENVFDFIVRHTFERPRELSAIGSELSIIANSGSYKRKSITDKQNMIRYAVHDVSHQNFTNYTQEQIPEFRKYQFDIFIKKLGSNVVDKERASKMAQDEMKYYYNLGLIGVISREPISNGIYKQKFLPVSRNGFINKAQLPPSPFYLTHPCMDQSFIDLLNSERFYNGYNIVGNGYPFAIPPTVDDTFNSWKPRRVSGGRMFNTHDKHELPLEDYYKAIFSGAFPYINTKVERFGERFWFFANLLYELWILKLADDLELDYANVERQNQISATLESRGFICQNTAILQQAHERTLLDFCEKLVMRLLVLACYLFLDLSLRQIRDLLDRCDYQKIYPKQKGNSAFNYIQAAFFIDGLSSDNGSRAKMRFKTKSNIWTSLSDHERRLLKDFREKLTADLSTLELGDQNLSVVLNYINQNVWNPDM